MLLDEFLETGGNQVKGLVPGGGPEVVSLTDQGRGKTIRMMDEFITETPLDTKVSLVYGRIVIRGDLYHLVIFYIQKKVAACSAIGAGGFHFFHFMTPAFASGLFFNQGADRTG